MIPPIKELREICKKPMDDDMKKSRPWYTERVNQPIAIHISRLLLYTSITATQVSFIVLILGLLSCALFLTGNPFINYIAAFFYQLSFLFDGVDGHIARYRNSVSKTGEYFDTLIHYLVDPLMLFSIGIGFYLSGESVIPFVAGFIAFFFFLNLMILSDLKNKILLNYCLKKGFIKKDDPYKKINKKSRFETVLYFCTLNPGKMILINLFAIFDLIVFISTGDKINLLLYLIYSYALIYSLSYIRGLKSILNNQKIDKEYESITS